MRPNQRLYGVRAGLAVLACLAATNTVNANAVTDWNSIAMEKITVGRPGPFGTTDMALVQIAVHDAVQAIDRRFEPYHAEVKGAKGRRSAAVAAAVRTMLVNMYTPQIASEVETLYLDYLANNGLNGDPGLEVGEQVALNILPLRRRAPTNPVEFRGEEKVGKWRPTPSLQGNPPAPPSNAPMLTPWLGALDPFTLTGPARFRAGPPPALTSHQYRRDYEEVKALGSLGSTKRSQQQTDIAYFYSENFFTQWNRALRGIADRYQLRTGDTARLFALANMAMADSLITVWESKVAHNVWRPITAIREGDNDGNPYTVGQADWQPLINTPNYPDYTSGANGVVAAMTRTLENFFGTDRVTFEVSSLAPLAQQKTRVYRRFSDASDDCVDARIYLGIHFRFADLASQAQGRRVADHAFDHYLLPIDGSGKDPRH
jgi:hypothetical protein